MGCHLSSLFRHTVYWHSTHIHKPEAQRVLQKKRQWWRKSEGGYIDEALGLLFSLLISLNLLIPILKPATLQCCHLLCVAPRQIKQSFIPLPFKHHGIQRSSISVAFPFHPYLVPDAQWKLGHLEYYSYILLHAHTTTTTRPFLPIASQQSGLDSGGISRNVQSGLKPI